MEASKVTIQRGSDIRCLSRYPFFTLLLAAIVLCGGSNQAQATALWGATAWGVAGSGSCNNYTPNQPCYDVGTAILADPNGEGFPMFDIYKLNPPQEFAAGGVAIGGASVSSQADHQNGSLSVNVNGWGYAIAAIFDTVTFYGLPPTGTTITPTMSGAASISTAASVEAFMTLFPESMFTQLCCGLPTGSGVGAAITTQPNWSFSATFGGQYGYDAAGPGALIYNDVPYVFEAALISAAGGPPGGGFLSASDPISFSLPQGASFTSASGTFLTGQTSGTIPEPESIALVGIGLLGLLGARRKRRQMQ